jgi:hypothetical protein
MRKHGQPPTRGRTLAAEPGVHPGFDMQTTTMVNRSATLPLRPE